MYQTNIKIVFKCVDKEIFSKRFISRIRPKLDYIFQVWSLHLKNQREPGSHRGRWDNKPNPLGLELRFLHQWAAFEHRTSTLWVVGRFSLKQQPNGANGESPKEGNKDGVRIMRAESQRKARREVTKCVYKRISRHSFFSLFVSHFPW